MTKKKEDTIAPAGSVAKTLAELKRQFDVINVAYDIVAAYAQIEGKADQAEVELQKTLTLLGGKKEELSSLETSVNRARSELTALKQATETEAKQGVNNTLKEAREQADNIVQQAKDEAMVITNHSKEIESSIRDKKRELSKLEKDIEAVEKNKKAVVEALTKLGS